MTENDKLQMFENQPIRTAWDEEQEEWYFSVVDVVAVLTDQPDSRHAAKYWSGLKTRLKNEGSELTTNCSQLKMKAADGKRRLTDVATTEQLIRIIQSIPSKKAEPFKMWLAMVGRERIEEKQDYEIVVLDKVLNCFEKKFLKLFQESVYMKNPFFREESEIRLCEFSPKQFLMGREVELSLGARLYNYSYYVKESQLISYVDFDFSDCLDQLIKELVIGPKCLMSERDMEYYLTTLGLSNCRVKKSQGTYR